jgi:hypothetical protein
MAPEMHKELTRDCVDTHTMYLQREPNAIAFPEEHRMYFIKVVTLQPICNPIIVEMKSSERSHVQQLISSSSQIYRTLDN